MTSLKVLRPREASIFACLADTVVAPAGGLPPVRDTDAAAAFDASLAAAPPLNRHALRAALYGLELAPLALGFRARLRRLDAARRTAALARLERVAPAAGLLRALTGVAHLCYYGDAGVLARLGYDAEAVVARGHAARTVDSRERRVVRGAEITGERIVTVDACVIGSGAGGAPAAKELAEGGMRVALLEEGDWHDTAENTARPRDMMARMYRDAGQTVTLGTPPIVLPLGRGVGGTTLVNSGTCFRTPDRVLARWRSEHGLDGMTPEALEPLFTRVEEIIGVAQVPAELAGRNALLVRQGAEALGLHGDFLRRNARGCVGSGVCAFGCPAGAKQHMGLTYVPLAWEAGATTYTGARVERIVVERGEVREVLARTSGGGRLRVRCEHAVVACGTLLTPGLLRRSGLGGASGMLGRNLSIHPASAARAVYDEPVDMWNGVPQSYYVDALASEGIMLEGIAGPPDQGAIATPATGAAHRDLMLRARDTGTFGVMVSDTGRGSVHEVFGRPVIRYDLHRDDAARFKRGFEVLADIFWAAGARRIVVPLHGVPVLRDGDSAPLRDARIRPRDVSTMAFHPLGTARAGADPRTSVVDGDLALHGVRGVHVADGSAVPTALGVNPQITIMALATRLAARLLGGRLS